MREENTNTPNPTSAKRSSRPIAANGARLTVTKAEDFVILPKYLLGFTPIKSIVFMVMDGSVLEMVARCDWRPGERAADVLSAVGVGLSRCTGKFAVVVGYGPVDEIGLLLDDLWVESSQISLDYMYVCDGNDIYANYDGKGWAKVGCADSTTSLIATQAVFAGMAAASSREELKLSLSGPTDEHYEEAVKLHASYLEDLIELDPEDSIDQFNQLIMAGVERPIEQKISCKLATLLSIPQVMIHALESITDETATHLVSVWSKVASQAPMPWLAAVQALLGLSGWVSGQGALLSICAELVSTSSPSSTLGEVLRIISALALHPREWPQLKKYLITEVPALTAA